MNSELKIGILRRNQFAKLPLVTENHLRDTPIYNNSPNVVNSYNSRGTKIRKGDEAKNPCFTTRAITCSAGFLRVRLNTKVHSYLMFHLLGAKTNEEDPEKDIKRCFRAKIKKFFGELDDLIKSKSSKIDIDFILVGGIGRLDGLESNTHAQEIKNTSTEIQEMIIEILEDEINKFKREKKNVNINKSYFTGQSLKSLERRNCLKLLPMTHLYYDGQNKLYIAPSYHQDEIEGDTNQHYQRIHQEHQSLS
jgi:hypothetical protein